MQNNIARENNDKYYGKVLKSKILKDRFDEIDDDIMFKIITDQISTEKQYINILDYNTTERIIKYFNNLSMKSKKKVLEEITKK